VQKTLIRTVAEEYVGYIIQPKFGAIIPVNSFGYMLDEKNIPQLQKFERLRHAEPRELTWMLQTRKEVFQSKNIRLDQCVESGITIDGMFYHTAAFFSFEQGLIALSVPYERSYYVHTPPGPRGVAVLSNIPLYQATLFVQRVYETIGSAQEAFPWRERVPPRPRPVEVSINIIESEPIDDWYKPFDASDVQDWNPEEDVSS
jgi:hypothetical protein